MKHFYEVEQASFQIVNNESEAEAVNTINQESPAGITAMALSSSAIYRYYQGQMKREIDPGMFLHLVSATEV